MAKKVQNKIKIGDFYCCKNCTKTCAYTKETKKNYPYCSGCKKERNT